MREAGKLLAIDAGTGSVRAVLFNARFKQLGSVGREYSHAAVPGHPGAQTFDTGGNWRLIADCVRGVLDKCGVDPAEIRAVSATSMREGIVLYDADGDEIWACPNSDSRAPRESEELIDEGSADRIYAVSGDWIAITAPPRLRWLQRHERETFERIRHLSMLSDWVLYRLSGEFATDPTVASSSAMFDLAGRVWSDEIVALCGLADDVLPPVLEPGRVVGGVTADAAADTGLREGTPVVTGGADTQLGILGLGISDPGQCTVLGGSFWQTTMLLSEPRIDPRRRLRTLCHVASDRWMIEGIGFWSGLTLRWLRDGFCGEEKQRAATAGVDAYELMEELAEHVPPGANGVTGVFSNLMDATRWVHAAPGFVGFDITSPERSGKAECIRAVEESAAYVVRGHLAMLEEITDQPISGITFSGGAAQGNLWPRILADVTGRRVSVPLVKESTALGAAVCAAVGVGIYPSLDAAVSKLPGIDYELAPNPDRTATYGDLYERWVRIYRHCLDGVLAGTMEPMWRAAGSYGGANRISPPTGG